jgi:uncharacterized repeat protein (TIGR01451 family)
MAIVSLIALTNPASGWSDGAQKIRLSATAQIEMSAVDEAGRHVKKRISAQKVVPGTEIIFTITYHNPTDQRVDQVVITNPIPKEMRYQNQSAFGEKTRITFSADKGQHFDLPENLFFLDSAGKRYPVQSDDYTHIRWKLDEPIPPQASGQVGFRAILH